MDFIENLRVHGCSCAKVTEGAGTSTSANGNKLQKILSHGIKRRRADHILLTACFESGGQLVPHRGWVVGEISGALILM
jgi:hypothetical protein